jgi:hypothetical protein
MKVKTIFPIRVSLALLLCFAWMQISAQQIEQTQEGVRILKEADRRNPNPDVSPVRRIERDPTQTQAPQPPAGFRSIDGWNNNPNQPSMGSAHSQLLRIAATAYADGAASLAGTDRPSARMISNIVCTQNRSQPNAAGATDFLWQWGQFLDHDLDLTDGADPAEPAHIQVPTGDPFFDPQSTGTQTISLNRSFWDSETGTHANNPRQQVNEITHWIDASNVYGSDAMRASALRTNDGSGKLKTSAGDLLPFNTEGLANAGGPSPELFLAGDVRANEQVGLLAMHTLFVREHNRLAENISANNPNMTGEEIYQRARNIVCGQMQAITYYEYLPTLLGRDALRPYNGYRPQVDASIANEFSTAAYRYGHSALSPQLLRLDENMEEVEAGHLPLRNAFFSPSRLVDEGGIDPILRGLSAQVCQDVDNFIIDDVRNFLFGPPGSGGFDLASLNIQRGRDHGLASYNDMRVAFGLAPKTTFEDINPDPVVARRLRDAYGSVDLIDAWVGGLAEAKHNNAMVGELVFTVLRDQFEALRDGDRFWFERTLPPELAREVRETRLSNIIRRNTQIGDELPRNVFRQGNGGPDGGGPGGPDGGGPGGPDGGGPGGPDGGGPGGPDGGGPGGPDGGGPGRNGNPDGTRNN